MRRAPLLVSILALVAGCVSRAPAPVVAIAPPPVAAAPVFAGYGNVIVPPRLADGSFATPNRLASPAGAIWHLRAGLNLAALACRDADEAATAASYNALLARERPVFAAAYRTLGQEIGDEADFDAAMTQLYNYYALPPARAGLCVAARQVLAEAAALPPGALAGFAPVALARLDAPYVAVFAAQETWLAGRTQPTMLARVDAVPQLTVDPAIFSLP